VSGRCILVLPKVLAESALKILCTIGSGQLTLSIVYMLVKRMLPFQLSREKASRSQSGVGILPLRMFTA
jgi:hypothetical protein